MTTIDTYSSILRRVEAKATMALQLAKCQAPIDVFALAKHRRVLEVKFLDMLPDGGLVPVSGGFELYVRDSQESVADFGGKSPMPILTPRQRFTIAHEVAHTFFFDLSTSPPVELNGLPRLPVLERVCNRIAADMLVPGGLLRATLRQLHSISATTVSELAKQFDVSVQMMVRRLATESLPSLDEAMILAYPTREPGDAQIRAVCYGHGLLSVRPRPAEFGSLRAWSGDLLPGDFFKPGEKSWYQDVGNRRLCVTKSLLASRSGAFLLELRDAQ